MNHPDEEQVVRGTVHRVTYRNPENGYSVIQIRVPDKREQITVVGNCPEPRVGAELVARGTFKTHAKFGKQLSATSITETEPTTPEGIEKLLGSGLIKGVGPKTAERIIERFGARALEVIHREPGELAKVPGVGRHKAVLISEAFAEKAELNEIMQFLITNNVSVNLATRIYEKYKNKAIEILKRDPYLLARQLRGVGFATADAIAMNIGLLPDSPQRLQAGLYYALERASEDGHCFLKEEDLVKRARVLLGVGDEYDLTPYIEALLKDEYIIEFRGGYFLRHLARAEEFVAKFVAERVSPFPKPQVDDRMVTESIRDAEADLGITFSFEQAEAARLANHYPLLLVTGGPGCGKTTLIRGLSRFFRKTGKRLLLGAPTGRAAQRMSQVCDYPASTIHRILRYDPINGGFLHGINEPLATDAIIIDEASMIDIQLAKDLFSAIGKGTTLILVGDKDQLPSVGPGRVFGDLLSLKEVKTVTLSKLFRRSQESTINTVAHMINSGIVPEIPEPDGVTKADAYFIHRRTKEEAALTIEKLVSDQIPRKFGIPPEDVAVLTPSNRGPLGTVELNLSLQARLNPPGAFDSEQEITINGTSFRVRDRVCQRVNNYNIDAVGVYNGDLGTVYSIDSKEKSLVVELWDGRLIKYEQGALTQLSLAYALTVHRSQGSEIPCVVLTLDYSHFTLLERQLFYTAVTRAKKLLIIVGSTQAVALAAKRTTSTKRCTMLRERILIALGEQVIEAC